MKCKIKRHYLIILLFHYFHSNSGFAQKIVSQPFTGHTSKHEINVWCMFKNTDSVYIKCAEEQTQVFTYNKASCFKKYLPINCSFKDLKENQSYPVQYSFNNIDFFPLITTATSFDTVRDISFLAGSCAFIGTGFNRAIKPFNSLKIFNHMKNDTADFMLWLGDNLYYVLQRYTYDAQLKRNVKTRLNKKLSAFLSSKQHYAIWDDHDYGSNNSDASFKYKSSSLDIFSQFWPNPKNDSFNYYSFTQSDAQFFMLDDRYNNEQTKKVLGDRQAAWLKSALLASKATFKFICIGMQALNPVSNRECFYYTATEYKDLIGFLQEHAISGVLFISGDRHHAELMQVKPENLYPLYDFTTSPLTMYPVKISKRSAEYRNPYRMENTYYPSYNYGKITVSGAAENRKCSIELKDKTGNTVWTRIIMANELKNNYTK